MPSVAPAHRRLPGVWALTVLTCLATLLLVRSPWLSTPNPLDAPDVPFLVLVAGLALAESVVVHIQFRRESHTFGFNEMVLALGLLAAEGHELVVAQILGTVIATTVRRQVLVKSAFNVAQYSLSSAVTVLVFAAVTPDPHLLDLHTAGGVLLGALAGSTVSYVLILAVIALADRPPAGGEAVAALVVGYGGVLANVGLGLSLLLLLREGPLALLCAAPAVAVAIASYRAHVAGLQRRAHLTFLLDATRALQSGGETGDTSGGWATVLGHLRDSVRADSATLLVAPAVPGSTAGEATWLALRASGASDSSTGRFEQIDADRALALLPRVQGRHDRRNGQGDPVWLDEQGWPCAISARITDEDRVLGHLVLGPVLGDTGTYSASDVDLVTALANQVGGVLETGRLEQALSQITVLKEQMQHEATHDPLTDLANRALFGARLAAALEDEGDQVSVMLLDLDDFKRVNDELGHAAGDALLRAVADRLRAAVRAGDTPARLGGDEFAVVLPGSPAATAAEVGARLVAAFAEPVDLDGARLPVHASIGTATRDGGAVAAEELVRRADMALYSVKQSGKAGARAWSRSVEDRLEGRSGLSSTMPRAVAAGEFVCHYQPVVELGSEQVVALEALVRWDHPERGLLAPEEFLAMAESTGWIREIGEQVLRQSCLEYAAVFRSFAEAPRRLHVNVSTAQLEAGLPSRVERALAESGFPGDRLVLEITGTRAVDDVVAARAVMLEVAESGVAWALDDFGTGFAALDRLAELPVSLVKLPGHLSRAVTRPRGLRVLRGALALAEEMGLGMVAEGVESLDQARVLEAAGCQQAQGYLWAPPMQPVDLAQWLRRVPAQRIGG